MTQPPSTGNWASTARHDKYLRMLPPLAVIVLALLAFFFALFRQGAESFSQAFPMYLLFAIPHFGALIALFRAPPSRTAFIGGFLSGFWGSCVLYLLFIGIFLFSQEYSHGNQKIEWFAGVAMGVWMVLGSLLSVKLEKSLYVKGALAGFLYPYAAVVYLAMNQRRR